MGENGYRPIARELEKDPYEKKLYARCVYKNGVVEDIEVTGKSILDIAKRKDENTGMISFQIHKKKTIVLDDIEIVQSCDFGTPTYFGKRVSAYEYYQKVTGRLPIGMIDEVTDKPITEEDLLGKDYVVFPDGSVIKHPTVGFKTFSEVLAYFQEKKAEQEEKHKKSL